MIAVILNDTSHYHYGCKKVIEYLISDLHSCGFTDIKLVGQDIKKIQEAFVYFYNEHDNLLSSGIIQVPRFSARVKSQRGKRARTYLSLHDFEFPLCISVGNNATLNCFGLNRIYNYDVTFENQPPIAYEVVSKFIERKDIGIEMRIDGLPEEALIKYTGSFHTSHIRKGRNMTGGQMESKKNYNGSNSSIELKSTLTLNYTLTTRGYQTSTANLQMFHFFSSAWNRDMGKGQIASVFTNWSSSRSKSKAYQLYGQRVGIIYPINGRNAFIL